MTFEPSLIEFKGTRNDFIFLYLFNKFLGSRSLSETKSLFHS